MKSVLSALILLLACVVMVSGITLSYFTDLSVESEIHFTTGTVKVDIEDISIADGTWADWKPGIENAKKVKCTLLNDGTMDTYLRICINRGWESNSSKTSAEAPEVTLVQTRSTVWTEKNNYWYYPEIVAPGQRVIFNFDVSLDSISGYLDEPYNLSLNVEAVQATNDTIPVWN